MKERSREIDELLPQLLMFRRLMHVRFIRASGEFDPYGWVRMETLRFVKEAGEPSMQDIARHLSVRAASATSLVGTLSRAGLVARRKSSTDKRLVCIALTTKGKRELSTMLKRGERVLSDMFKTLGKADIRALTLVLGRLGAANSLK